MMKQWSLLPNFGATVLRLSREPERPDGDALKESFLVHCRTMDRPRVLELGTKRSIANRSTRHDAWIPDAGEFLGSDISLGKDVDIVADVHRLTHEVGEEQFNVIISCSTFEHFKYPHLAAHEIMRALKIGGVLFIQTHQTFPLHDHPYDYFRYSREALAGLFGAQMGFQVIATDYEFPAKVLTFREKLYAQHPSFLNVRLYGKKVAKTPPQYVYEYDVQLPDK
jgi:SAM-dependent methyltransferase